MHSPGIRLSNQGRLSGGIVILVKKALTHLVSRLDVTGDNVVVCRVKSSNSQDNIIVCTYIPPIDSPYYSNKENTHNWSHTEDLILNIQEKYPQAVILLCGDMNARIGKWDLHSDEEDTFIDKENPSWQTCACTNFQSRQSQDDKCNTFGRILTTM